MNIMLIDPPSLEGNVVEAKATKQPTPNLGLIYIATHIKNNTNADVQVIDMAAEQIGFSDLTSKIDQNKPELIGLSSKTFNVLSAYKIAKIVKSLNSDIIVILGGAHATALPENTLNECPEIDAVVIREGEYAALDLVKRMEKGFHNKDDLFNNLNGTVYKNKNGIIVENKKQQLIDDLDSLPYPDLSFVNYNNYLKVYNPNKNIFQHVYPVFASRGCPFNCTFCMPLLTRKYRLRKPGRIINEIEALNEKHGAERIYFEDSLFGANKDWFIEFCNEYIDKGLNNKVQWGFETRVDKANYDFFLSAKRAGCIYTYFGIESGDEEVLKKANKGYSVELIKKTVFDAKKAGIDQIHASFILGLPYETKASISNTLNLLKDLPLDGASINILDVYPGTEVFKMVDQGTGGLRWIKGKRYNWDRYKRHEPMVEVNDVDSEYLLRALKKAREIINNKKKENKKEFILWQSAFENEFGNKNQNWHLERFTFYWKNDKKRLVKIIKNYLINDMPSLINNTYTVIKAYTKRHILSK